MLYYAGIRFVFLMEYLSKMHVGSALGAVCLVLSVSSQAGVPDDLARLRTQCLYYAAGHAPNDTNTITLRHGLYAQSPFSPAGEVDLAASGFSLAALPAAVASGVISFEGARQIATKAAAQVKLMVTRSAGALAPGQVERYGRYGLLCHYPVWDGPAGEFRAQAGVEFSSIDTTLLLYGLLVSGNYFGGQVRADYEAARDAIRWRDLLDTSTPGHRDQFHMSYRPGTGFYAWWDWCTQEAMLVCVFASMSDEHIQPANVWRAWRRDVETYTSPGPDSKSFTCCASYFGDPFTSLYGLAFLDFTRFPRDLDDLDWFRQGQTAYRASVEFFKKERGYRDNLSSGFSICAPNGFMSKPNGNHAEPLERIDATVYTLAGGLAYYGGEAASNPLASTLSRLVTNTPGFFGWHGWPAPTVNATSAAHDVLCDKIVGQDISFIGLVVDNYLTGRAQNLVLQDPAIRRVLNRIFPPNISPVSSPASHETKVVCRGIPFASVTVERSNSPAGRWERTERTSSEANGTVELKLPGADTQRFYRLEIE
jgi:hypothetical protein